MLQPPVRQRLPGAAASLAPAGSVAPAAPTSTRRLTAAMNLAAQLRHLLGHRPTGAGLVEEHPPAVAVLLDEPQELADAPPHADPRTILAEGPLQPLQQFPAGALDVGEVEPSPPWSRSTSTPSAWRHRPAARSRPWRRSGSRRERTGARRHRGAPAPAEPAASRASRPGEAGAFPRWWRLRLERARSGEQLYTCVYYRRVGNARKRRPPNVHPIQRRVLRALSALSSPLLVDDYLELINALWSTRELRGRVEEIKLETEDAGAVMIKPG